MKYFVGWDVGAWDCDNGKSRDALVALAGTQLTQLSVVGRPWRGNLKDCVCGDSVIGGFFGKMDLHLSSDDSVVVAIDTPLGWPDPFRSLIQRDGTATARIPAAWNCNPYLYRQTELWLADRKFQPLSAVTHMIGSQSTKGLHFLRQTGFKAHSAGVWVKDAHTTIEAYPSPARSSHELRGLFLPLAEAKELQKKCAAGTNVRKDVTDSLWCALIAASFELDRARLVSPPDSITLDEGWIWIPSDCKAEGAEAEGLE